MTATPTDEEIALLARQAGLDLPPEYLQELVDAYGHVRRMIDRIPTAGRAATNRRMCSCRPNSCLSGE